MRTLQIGMGWFDEQSGGLNRYYRDLLHFLPGAGVDVAGLVAGTTAVAERSGGSVRAFAEGRAPLPARLNAARAASVRLVAEQRPDLVASHFTLYTLPMLPALRRVPRVVHFHGPWAAEAGREGASAPSVWAKRRLVERPAYRGARRHIALSEAFARVLHQDYGVAEDTIRVVPGGIDADRFETPLSRPEARARLGWAADRPIVFAVRRLVPRMGLEDLVEAMAEVCRRVPEALLLIGGRGPLDKALRGRIAARGIERHVDLLGFVPDDLLPLAYRAADLSVVPTTALEGFGLISIESLAAGTPVLVTPVGGLPEAVGGLSASLVLPGTGAGALAESVTAALTGRLPLPGSAECRAYVRARFDWPIVARRIRGIYEEALS